MPKRGIGCKLAIASATVGLLVNEAAKGVAVNEVVDGVSYPILLLPKNNLLSPNSSVSERSGTESYGFTESAELKAEILASL